MSGKRYVRTITGEVYDVQTDTVIDEDFVGKGIMYEDGVIKLLNKLNGMNEKLLAENEGLKKRYWCRGR